MPSLKPKYEVQPKSPIPRSYRPPDSIEHRVFDGEDWYSVAKRYNLPVKYLIYSNFKTMIPEEINWYLREYIRCDLPTNDRKNWRFSTSAQHGEGMRAGIVYIPLNWKAISEAAKLQTQVLVSHWFLFATLGPEFTNVSGAQLIILQAAVHSKVDSHSPTVQIFKERLRAAGAPDRLADSWADCLLKGLHVFTQGINDINYVAFPSLSGPSSFGLQPPANPWPLLVCHSNDNLLKLAAFQNIVLVAGIDGSAARNAIRNYAKWFDVSFAVMRQETRATNVTPMVTHTPNGAQGHAIGNRGFLVGPGMR